MPDVLLNILIVVWFRRAAVIEEVVYDDWRERKGKEDRSIHHLLYF